MGANSIWLPPNNPLISSNDISMFLVQAMLILSIVMVVGYGYASRMVVRDGYAWRMEVRVVMHAG